MKKIYLVILLIIIILAILITSIILINNNNSNNKIELPATQNYTDSQSIDNIFMSIKDGSITPTGLTVIIDDKNEIKSKVLISWNYRIDKKIGNEWEEIYSYVSPIEIAVADLPYPYEEKLNWSDELGELQPGTYRIRYYPIPNQSKEVEFNITDSQSIDNIFMSIKDGSITPTGLTVIIDDKNEIKSNVPISWDYRIDKKIGNEWKEIYCYVSPIEIYVESLKYPYESSLDWSKELGELGSGTYRIRYYPIRNQSKEVEFNIN